MPDKTKQRYHIGVFDTGAGGRLVADRLKKLLPNCRFTVVNDAAHAPYGGRPEAEIIRFTDNAIQPLLPCQYIVIACNTATVTAIKTLRQKYPDNIFIGFEPMIKTAAQVSQKRHITLLATDATKQSSRLKELIRQYAADFIIDEPDTHDWARKIDAEQVDQIQLSEVARSIESGSDTIVIGCTHYLAIEKQLRGRFRGVAILEPTKAVANRLDALTKEKCYN